MDAHRREIFLEFELAKGGSPELDMCHLFAWKRASSPPFQKGFLDGYAESGEIGPHFWDRRTAGVSRLVASPEGSRPPFAEKNTRG